MKKLINKINGAMLRAQIAATNFLTEERGDTNFISIAIILVVVLVLAAVFIRFGNELLPQLTAAKDDVLNALSGG